MDRIQVACPSCPAMLSLPAGRAGPVECPKCQSTFTADTRKKGRIDDDEEWRDRLLRALGETGARRPPPKARSLYAKLILRIVAVTLVFLPVLWGIDTLNDASAKDLSTPWQFRIDFWLLSSVIVLSIITSALGVPIIRLRRQIRAVGAEKALQSATSRPILYLRSFNVDELIGRQTLLDHLFRGNFYSDSLGPEDQLTRRFSKLGPMIAIGRPGEELPSLGAARFYVSNDKWQEKVADIAREAQFIVWVSGTTGGLHWELNHLIQTVAPSKLIVWAHPHLMRLSAPKREREWRSFLERLGNTFPVPLPSRLGETRLFFFGPTYVPRPVKPNEYALRLPQADALRNLFVAKGLLTPPAWAWRLSNRISACLFGAVVGMMVKIPWYYFLFIINPDLRTAIEEETISRSDNLFSNHIFLYFTFVWERYSLLNYTILGILFVLMQPRLARVRGGYLVGSLLIVMIYNEIILPPIYSIIHWKISFPLLLYLRQAIHYHDFARVSIGERVAILYDDWLPAVLYINTAVITDLAWVVPVILLLRFLPFAPGRPRRPHLLAPSNLRA